MQTGDSGNGDFEGDRQAASLPTEESTVAGETRKKSRLKRAIEGVFPHLSFHGGATSLSYRKSVFIVAILYASHSLSAWGDRMWGFVVSLFLVILYPGSLLMPAIYGFLVALSVSIFGTVVGDWVDNNPRMKVAWMSLLIQNSLVALCSVALALMFHQDWDVCNNVAVFGSLTAVVIVLGSGAALATTANTISIEKDWVVVIADKNADVLAVLNANMRRIDLVCKLVAPAVTGVFLAFTSSFATTIIVASWNIVSFFGELGLIWLVYRMVPSLSRKKHRKQSTIDMKDFEREEKLEQSSKDIHSSTDDLLDPEKEDTQQSHDKNSSEDKDSNMVDTSEEDVLMDDVIDLKHNKGHTSKKIRDFLLRLVTPLTTITNGWKIYWKQEIRLVGFSMASIYLTVLGFSGVTSAYFVTQGLRVDLIGVFQGVGAIFGVLGTLGYPFIRQRVGTVRTGLFGISTQLFILMSCVAAVILGYFHPSHRIVSSGSEGYYSPNCNDSSALISVSLVPMSTHVQQCVLPTKTTSFTMTTGTTHFTMATQQMSYNLSASTTMHSLMISPTKTYSSSMPTSYLLEITPSPSSNRRRFARNANYLSHTSQVTCHTPTPSQPSQPNGSEGGVALALVFMLIGVVCCRIGLWTFDLAVQQLVQEKVVEEERGVVSGVMGAMNSIMDMLHYVLVIAAPKPEHFGILALISVAMIAVGWLLYALYVRKARGHFFHFSDYKRKGRKCVERGRGESELVFEEEGSTCLVNNMAEEEQDGTHEDDQ